MGWMMTAIAGLTAFYMFRLYYGIFWGTRKPRDSMPRTCAARGAR